MGAFFSCVTGDIQNATAASVAMGRRTTFAVAAAFILLAIAIRQYSRWVESLMSGS